ncbi:MAG: hypothetical protein JWQ35_1578 [Bacteriovoracaceae bacterium]|nr:hypothetical protein [Bacteriovoracaceae bacterium]
MKTLCLAITGFFLYSHSIFALAADPADLLFQAFSAKCESQGSFTARALNETNALEGVLSAVLTDPECKGLLPVLNSVTNLSQQLSFLDQGFGDDQKKDLEAYAEKVSIYLSTVSDPTQQSLLVGELANTQVEILKYDQTKQELKRQAQNRAIQSLGNYVESLAQIYPSQALCFERNNTLPLQLGSQLLSLSGGFFGPVINAATTLGGRLFSALFDYFRDKKFVDAIKKFRGAKLQAGLSCAMEALEQTVCDIDDQKALLKVHEKYRTQPEVPVEWKGYDLLERQYSVVQSFLRQIEAGSDPASDLQGSSRANIRTMEGNYRSTIERTLGLMGETARQIELLTQRTSGHDAIQQVSRNLLDS